jgi:hypothetical protein
MENEPEQGDFKDTESSRAVIPAWALWAEPSLGVQGRVVEKS